MQQMFSTGDLARIIGKPRYVIDYLISTGDLPEAKVRFAGKRCFSSEEVEEILKFFQSKSFKRTGGTIV